MMLPEGAKVSHDQGEVCEKSLIVATSKRSFFGSVDAFLYGGRVTVHRVSSEKPVHRYSVVIVPFEPQFEEVLIEFVKKIIQ